MTNHVFEYIAYPERDRKGIQTGRYFWEVYEAISSAPVFSGTAQTLKGAELAGSYWTHYFQNNPNQTTH